MLPKTFSAAPLTGSMLKYFRISRNHQHKQKQQEQQQQKKETIRHCLHYLPTLVLAFSPQNIGRFKLATPNLGLMRPRVTRRRQHKTTKKKNENTTQTTTTIMSNDREL
jgi:Na+/melibiose symporter-like transporter